MSVIRMVKYPFKSLMYGICTSNSNTINTISNITEKRGKTNTKNLFGILKATLNKINIRCILFV